MGNWKGSRASKIILHLLRPLLILKSPRKPTKNILGLGNNKRHVHMNIHTQPVQLLILFLFKDSTLLTLTLMGDPWPQFLVLSHQMLAFCCREQWKEGHRAGCPHVRCGGTSETELVPFELHCTSHLDYVQPRTQEQAKQTL